MNDTIKKLIDSYNTFNESTSAFDKIELLDELVTTLKKELPKPVPYVLLWAASLKDYSTFVLGDKRRCVAKNFDPEVHKYPFMLKCDDNVIRFAGMMKNDPYDSCEDKAFQPMDEMMNDWGITGMMVYNNDTDTWEDL